MRRELSPGKKATLKGKRRNKPKQGEDFPEEVFSDKDYEATLRAAEKIEKSSTSTFFIAAGIILVSIVVIIAAGVYIKQHTANRDEYRHFTFVKSGPFWETMIQKEGVLTVVPFYYHPRELESIATEPGVQDKILNFTRNGTIFITLNPDLNASIVRAGVQIARITGERYGILNFDTRSAITNLPSDYNASQNITAQVATCADVNETILIIELVKGPTEAIFSRGNCIIVEGRDEDQVLRSAEKLDYLLLGIMT